MDSETITARQIGYTYMINSSTFAKRYKDTLSNFETWEQKDHASKWILIPQNVGKEQGIAKIILWLYENHLIEKGKSGYGLKRYDAVEKSQCEHIAPNTENQDANSGYCPYDDEFRESYLNCLGNYLLLSGHHNESIGNTSFEAKRNTYTQLLQQQEIRNMTEQDHLWNKAKIDKRKELIVDFVMATF